jgi:hypothetical protein
MPSVVVHAVELSRIQNNAPDAQPIDQAFAAVSFGGGNWGGWVGPRPRITRRAIVTSGFQTDAAYLYSWPDNAFTAAHAAYQQAQLLAQVQQMLAPVSSDWTVTIEQYAPAVNGDTSWWSTGNASITTTRDEFPTTSGRVDATENPVGPTTDATHPSTPGQVAAGIGRGLGSILTAPIIALAVVAVIVLAPKGGLKGPSKREPAKSSGAPAVA